MDQPALTLLQYGAVGAIAVLAIAALAYVTRRYISHLEESDERWREVMGAVTRTLTTHESREAERHDEVLRALTARRTDVQPVRGHGQPDRGSA